MSIGKLNIFGNIKKSEAKKFTMENYKFKGTMGMTEHKKGEKIDKSVRQTEGHLSLHVLTVVKTRIGVELKFANIRNRIFSFRYVFVQFIFFSS